MGRFFRCVYIPMPELRGRGRQDRLANLIGNPVGFQTTPVPEGETAWKMYSTRQDEIKKWGLSLVKRFQRKNGGGHPILLWHGLLRPLANLRSTAVPRPPTVLYVHCHGNSQFVGFRPLALDHNELAQRLEADGLDKTDPTLRVKLWSCHSGEAYGAEDTFVQKFADAMEGLGYHDLEIVGYRGALRVNRIGRRKTAQVGNNDPVRAKTAQVIVRTGPAPIPPPAPVLASASGYEEDEREWEEGDEDGLRPYKRQRV